MFSIIAFFRTQKFQLGETMLAAFQQLQRQWEDEAAAA